MSSSSAEGRDEQSDPSGHGSSFVRTSVKSVIRALSSARFATPILPAQRRSDDVLTSARQSGRELFAEEPNSTNGNIGLSSTSVNQIPLNGLDVESEALPIFSSSVIGGGEEDFATLGRTGEVRSTVKQMRSVFGADPFSEPEIRSLLDGPTHFLNFPEANVQVNHIIIHM